MALTTRQIIDAAYEQVTDNGFGGLTMRRLAEQLAVQPGALYYHFASKQDLVAAVAERLLAETRISTSDPAQAALDIRAALLPIRDSAEVISFVNAFRPEVLQPLRRFEEHFGSRLPAQKAKWTAQTLVHYVLGFVAAEQNRGELIRAGIVTLVAEDSELERAFRFGVDAVLKGSLHAE